MKFPRQVRTSRLLNELATFCHGDIRKVNREQVTHHKWLAIVFFIHKVFADRPRSQKATLARRNTLLVPAYVRLGLTGHKAIWACNGSHCSSNENTTSNFQTSRTLYPQGRCFSPRLFFRPGCLLALSSTRVKFH